MNITESPADIIRRDRQNMLGGIMDTQTHTPGPWITRTVEEANRVDLPGPRDWRVTDEYLPPATYNCTEVVDDHAEIIVARVYDCNKQGGFGEAHARLIASAPALLAALERHTCVKCDKRFGWDGIRPNCDFCIDARDAIAQARGEAKR